MACQVWRWAHLKYDVALGTEEAKVALVAEVVEGGVEEVGGEGGDHAAEEDLPGQLHAPEGGDLLHSKEEATHRGAKGRGHTGRCPR